MSKEYDEPSERSWIAASLRGFRSVKFHDRREERGGAKNHNAKYLSDYAMDEEIKDELSVLDEE